MADEMIELNPCPFCGGSKARTIHIRDGRKVACICGACGKPEFHGPLDRPNADTRAITAWNTRAPDPRIETLQTRVKELEGALEPFAAFIEKYDAKPMNLADDFYAIHVGTEYEAIIRLSDFRRARAALNRGGDA